MTSRTLVIMRHAKAEQSESLPDIKRALTARGRGDARKVGAWLAARSLAPDVVLCSPSIRTRGTWHEVAIGLTEADTSASATVRYEDELYSGGVSAALATIRSSPDDAGIVLLIGHNPTVSALSVRLDEDAERATPGLRTAGIAIHDVTTSWADCVAAKMTSASTPRA